MPTTWIPSEEAFGTPSFGRVLGPSGIASEETFGTPIITSSSVTLLQPLGIPSGQVLGTPTQVFLLDPNGIPSAESFGFPTFVSTFTVILCSGTARGFGVLTCGVLVGGGIAPGTATLLPPTPNYYHLRSGLILGQGQLFCLGPQPIIGTCIVRAFVELVKVPRPLCPPRRVKVFRYGYILTRDDLELRVRDDFGNPYAPVAVSFAFYQIVPGGQRMLAGPANRMPAVDQKHGKPGRYYATGTAGELGQPGTWVVVWSYQQFWWSPIETSEEHFKVEDEVTSCDPYRFNKRHRKYGWV